MNKAKVKLLILSGFVLISFSSCIQSRYACYMQNEIVNGEIFKNSPAEYKIQSHDVLYIKIKGMNNEVAEQFNMDNTFVSSYNNESGSYINGYLVNNSGYIELPVLGIIKAAGKTTQEIQQLICEKAGTYIKNVLVIVRLAGFKITIFGEVQNPGVYNITDRINIFELLTMAGDITDYGNKKKALLIRKTNEGSQTFTINLTENKIISSDFYYLQPNDLIYIQPIKTKYLKKNITNATGILPVISTLILITNFIR